MAHTQTDRPTLMKIDRRHTYRITVTQPCGVTIRHGADQSGVVTLKDLSESGCLIQNHRPLAHGESLRLTLDLPHQVSITDARIVWTNGTRYGIEFVRVSPVERARLWRFLWKSLGQASATDLQPLVAITEEPHYSRTDLRLVP